ncbi:MAG: hypothetical protein ACLUSK_14465 [Bacteroides stercoris]
MKESIILKYIWLLSGNFMIAILLAACNGSNITLSDNPDEEIVENIPETFHHFQFGDGYGVLVSVVTQLRGESFGVKAYDTAITVWAAAGYNAKPDTDWNNVRIDCSDSGVCTYAPAYPGAAGYTILHIFSVIIRIITPRVTVSDANHEGIDTSLHRVSSVGQ